MNKSPIGNKLTKEGRREMEMQQIEWTKPHTFLDQLDTIIEWTLLPRNRQTKRGKKKNVKPTN
jgi:hypothetical protein